MPNYEEMHVDELAKEARERKIPGRSKMGRESLIKALIAYDQEHGVPAVDPAASGDFDDLGDVTPAEDFDTDQGDDDQGDDQDTEGKPTKPSKPVPKAKVYKLLNDIMLVNNGVPSTLSAGRIIDSKNYDMKRLRDAGADLAEIT